MKYTYGRIVFVLILFISKTAWGEDSNREVSLTEKHYNQVSHSSPSLDSGNKVGLSLINSVTSSDIPENVSASGFGFTADMSGRFINVISLSGESDHQYVDTSFTDLIVEAGLEETWQTYIYGFNGMMNNIKLKAGVLIGMENQTVQSDVRGIDWDFVRYYGTLSAGFNKRFTSSWDLDFRLKYTPATAYYDEGNDISAQSNQSGIGYDLRASYFFGGNKNFGISAGMSSFIHSAFSVSLVWRG